MNFDAKLDKILAENQGWHEDFEDGDPELGEREDIPLDEEDYAAEDEHEKLKANPLFMRHMQMRDMSADAQSKADKPQDKPILLALSKPGEQSFRWMSSGWGRNRELMAKATGIIKQGNTIADVISKLEEAGFHVLKGQREIDRHYG